MGGFGVFYSNVWHGYRITTVSLKRRFSIFVERYFKQQNISEYFYCNVTNIVQLRESGLILVIEAICS